MNSISEEEDVINHKSLRSNHSNTKVQLLSKLELTLVADDKRHHAGHGWLLSILLGHLLRLFHPH